jgi:hypothetical protein
MSLVIVEGRAALSAALTLLGQYALLTVGTWHSSLSPKPLVKRFGRSTPQFVTAYGGARASEAPICK